MKKAIITGGAGFIGSHLVDALVNLGIQVSIIDDFSTGKVENVNKKHWNFDLHWVENLEYLKYGKDGHFDWHVDQALNPYTIEQNPNPNFTNRIRKLSVSVQLSESKDYEGGNLELENPFSESLAIDKKINTLNTAQDRSIGTLIIFPSFVRHRVTPIKKGLRQSLVLWYLGDRYR